MIRQKALKTAQNDEVVEQVRAAREAYAALFDFDLTEMYRDLKAREQAGQRNMADITPVDRRRPDATGG